VNNNVEALEKRAETSDKTVSKMREEKEELDKLNESYKEAYNNYIKNSSGRLELYTATEKLSDALKIENYELLLE